MSEVAEGIHESRKTMDLNSTVSSDWVRLQWSRLTMEARSSVRPCLTPSTLCSREVILAEVVMLRAETMMVKWRGWSRDLQARGWRLDLCPVRVLVT